MARRRISKENFHDSPNAAVVFTTSQWSTGAFRDGVLSITTVSICR